VINSNSAASAGYYTV